MAGERTTRARWAASVELNMKWALACWVGLAVASGFKWGASASFVALCGGGLFGFCISAVVAAINGVAADE